jgi:hypothetical protein
MKKLQGVVFESKAWQIQVDEGMVFVINKRFESEGRYEACTEVTSDMVESFEIKGVKVPKYLREELALVFHELETMAKQETEMEFVGVKAVWFFRNEPERNVRVYKDQFGMFVSYKYRESGIQFMCVKEGVHGGLFITFDPHELAKYRDGRSTLEEYKATLEPVREEATELSIDNVREEIEKIKQGSGVWALNGQIQTGKKFPYVWRNMELVGDEMKYTFVQGLDFENKIVIYEMDEKAAWNQLLKILKERKVEEILEMETPFEVAPEVELKNKGNITLVMTPQAHFSLILGRKYTIEYKDAHGEYELKDLSFLGHSIDSKQLFFGDSFENIIRLEPLKIQRILVDIMKQH